MIVTQVYYYLLLYHFQIRLKSNWLEPPIIWSIIVSLKGSLKSPTFDLLTKPLQELQESMQQANDGTTHESEEDEQAALHMSNSQFTFPKLHNHMYTIDGHCLLLYDELSMFLDQLQNQNAGSESDRKVMEIYKLHYYHILTPLYNAIINCCVYPSLRCNEIKLLVLLKCMSFMQVLLSLYNGGPWLRNTKLTGANNIPKTHFNYSGKSV